MKYHAFNTNIGKSVWYYPHFYRPDWDTKPFAAIICHEFEDGFVNVAWFNEDGISHSAIRIRLVNSDEECMERCCLFPIDPGTVPT